MPNETEKLNEINETEINKTMFDNVDDVENEFSENAEIPEMGNVGETEFSLDDVKQSNFIKAPKVGETATYIVEKIVKNPNIEGTNSKTGQKFKNGVTTSDKKTTLRNDVHTDKGVFTISSWELYYKIVGGKSDLINIVRERQKRTGKAFWNDIELTIRHNYDGSYDKKPTAEVMKLLDMTEEEADDYKAKVSKAIKEHTLYTVVVRDLTLPKPVEPKTEIETETI